MPSKDQYGNNVMAAYRRTRLLHLANESILDWFWWLVITV